MPHRGATAQTSARARGLQLPHRSPRYGVVHFDVPTTDGREILSVDSRGLLPAAARSGLEDDLVIHVRVDNDGNYSTDYRVPGEPFESLDKLIHAAGAHLLAALSNDLPWHEEQQHVVGSASSQVPVPELQHLNYGASRNQTCEEQHQVGGKPAPELQHLHAEASSDLLCQEQQHVGGTASEASCDMPHLHTEASCDMPCQELVSQAASSEMLQEQDFSSLKNFLNTATLDGLSVNATSSSLVQSDAVAQDTIEIPPPPWHCLSSLPIWVVNRYEWGYTFYIREDLMGLFHTYPWVGKPVQSLQEANSAIDCYLEEHRNTMFMDEPGISQVEKVVRKCLYWPDGKRKRHRESEPRDERRDSRRQLVRTLVDKYNEYNHLIGDLAYEVKDVVGFNSVQGASDPGRVHYHINFTMKTKGADDPTRVIDDLFFAEVTKRGRKELVVSCFCRVNPTDNGCCHGCDVKHPNDAAAYTGGQVGPLDVSAKLGGMEWMGYYETLEEEETRIRRIYEPQDHDDPEYVEIRRKTVQP
ncbi:unnamed protein product [Alopecurus aequalis]